MALHNHRLRNTLIASLACLLFPGLSSAHHAGMFNAGYVGQANGHLVTDGFGRCVTTSAWTEAMAVQDCGGNPTTPKSEPVAAKTAHVAVTETLRLSASALFDTNKAEIKPAGRKELDAFLAKIKDRNVQSLKITGHTDDQGADAYNQKLSERRAEAVKSYLSNGGVDAGKISTRGEGETNPIADNKTPSGRAKNRRVDIEVKTLP